MMQGNLFTSIDVQGGSGLGVSWGNSNEGLFMKYLELRI